MRRAISCIAFVLISVATAAAQQRGPAVLIVTGSSGEARHARAFDAWAGSVHDAVTARFGVPESSVVYLSEQPNRDSARMRGRSDKETIRRTFADIATRTSSGDQVFIMLIGHGSAESGEPRFNIPGPDLTAAELAAMLTGLKGRQIAVVHAASASGAFVKELSAASRIVITATRSAAEKNETIFGGHFAKALDPAVGDTDKDGAISLREAFEYASREVARTYEQQKRLPTEHALLDDNGDGVGSTNTKDGGDGALAAAFAFRTRATASADPALRALYDQKQDLERRVAALRQRKSSMTSNAYEAELEKLLLELATKTQSIRKAEGGQ
jgi:hypothetical protein